MAGETIPLTLRADISELRKEISKIPGITAGEAKKMSIALERNFKKAENASKAAAKASAKAQKSAAAASANAWRDFGTATVAAFSAAAVGMAAMVKATADQRNAITDMASRTGIAADTLAGLQLAAEGSGRQFADMNEVLNPLVARLGQVQAGNKAAEDTFTNLGVSLRDSSGELVSNDRALKRVVDRLQSIEDPSEKAGVAIGLIGEGGGKLVQVLGDAPLKAFVDQTERFGVDVGPEAAKSASDLKRSMADLSMVLGGVTADIAGLFPTQKIDDVTLGLVFVTEAARAFAEVLKTEVTNNLGLLNALLEGNFQAANAFALAISNTDEVLEDVNKQATDAARAFFDDRNAIRAAGEAADLAATAHTNLGISHKDADAAAREQETTEKALAKATWEATNETWDNMAKFYAWRSEQRDQDEAEETTAREKRLDAETQAEMDRIALIQQTMDEEERMRDAQDAWQAARDAERKEGIERLRDAAIEAAGAAASAVLDGIARRREANADDIEARLDAAEAEIRAKDQMSEKDKERMHLIHDTRKEIAMKRFRGERREAVASIAMNAASAIVMALAQLGPIAGAFAGAAIGITAGTQAGIVAAQKPPAFHIGRSPDEQPATLLKSEAVLDARATSALGGANAVQQLNETGRMQQGQNTSIDDVSRAVAMFVAREMGGEGPLGRSNRRAAPSVRSVFK